MFGLYRQCQYNFMIFRAFLYSRYGQWKQLDHFAPPVWLENIARYQAVVDTRVLVLLQLWQPFLTDVNHDCELA